MAPDEAVDGIEEACDRERDQQVLGNAEIRGELGHLLLGSTEGFSDLVAVHLDVLGCLTGTSLDRLGHAGSDQRLDGP